MWFVLGEGEALSETCKAYISQCTPCKVINGALRVRAMGLAGAVPSIA